MQQERELIEIVNDAESYLSNLLDFTDLLNNEQILDHLFNLQRNDADTNPIKEQSVHLLIDDIKSENQTELDLMLNSFVFDSSIPLFNLINNYSQLEPINSNRDVHGNEIFDPNILLVNEFLSLTRQDFNEVFTRVIQEINDQTDSILQSVLFQGLRNVSNSIDFLVSQPNYFYSLDRFLIYRCMKINLILNSLHRLYHLNMNNRLPALNYDSNDNAHCDFNFNQNFNLSPILFFNQSEPIIEIAAEKASSFLTNSINFTDFCSLNDIVHTMNRNIDLLDNLNNFGGKQIINNKEYEDQNDLFKLTTPNINENQNKILPLYFYSIDESNEMLLNEIIDSEPEINFDYDFLFGQSKNTDKIYNFNLIEEQKDQPFSLELNDFSEMINKNIRKEFLQ